MQWKILLKNHLWKYRPSSDIRKIVILRYLKFHGLRHTMASILCESVPITTISKILGHSRTSTTADIYLHESMDSQIDAAAKLDETIGNIRKTG